MRVNQIYNILNKDPKRNLNTLNFIENQTITKSFIVGESVLIKGISDEEWIYISSQDEDELLELINYIDSESYFFLEEWMVPFVIKKEIQWQLTCEKLVLDESVQVQIPTHEVTKLTIDDAEFIQNNHDYSEYTDVEYIKECITNRLGYGIRYDNQLVAWALIHDDGAIGFLRVLPEYIGQGLAKSITNKMIIELRKLGKLPCVHIEKTNYKSLALAKKTGFKYVSTVTWVKIK